MPKFNTGWHFYTNSTKAFMYYIIAHKRKIIKRKVKKEGYFTLLFLLAYEGMPGYSFIPSTVAADFAVISTQAGRKPLFIALRTDLILDQAAQ